MGVIGRLAEIILHHATTSNGRFGPLAEVVEMLLPKSWERLQQPHLLAPIKIPGRSVLAGTHEGDLSGGDLSIEYSQVHRSFLRRTVRGRNSA